MDATGPPRAGDGMVRCWVAVMRGRGRDDVMRSAIGRLSAPKPTFLGTGRS